MEKIEIGTKLFRVASPALLQYVCTGIRQYETGDLYEVECQSCTHGFKCKVLAGYDDYDKLTPIHMLNNDEDDDQRCWHGNETHFFMSKDAALLDRANGHIRKAREGIEAAEKSLQFRKDELQRLVETAELHQSALALQKQEG
ncbi:hypothetical protein ACCS68_14685 [Rhizobium beringeri]|uniref:hypothetical protein n=1 Tax=Rhizobium TaxID=379 RepID=UPI0010321096|nr:hypothetical protein [Rhizobium leguminosarum]TBH23607.1 hypothetical protein ELG64_08875 [Rhizobium leguminosarum]